MLDEICSQLCLRTATGRWTTLEEINESIESQGLESCYAAWNRQNSCYSDSLRIRRY